MPDTAHPSQRMHKRSQGFQKPLFEGGETKRIQLMDTTNNNNSITADGKRKLTIDFQKLREQWFTKYSDILSGVPPELPPLREINHRIPLIDESKRYAHRLPRCPEAM